jgi:hypothetical protein
VYYGLQQGLSLQKSGRTQTVQVQLHYVVCVKECRGGKIPVQIPHKSVYTFRYGSKIMIIQLLAFGRCMSKNSSAGKQKIRSCICEACINYKIFLFPTQRCIYFGNILIKILAYIYSCLIQGNKCFQQWCLCIQ